MGNPIPPGDGLAPLVDKLGAQDRRLRELETFDASQYARAIEKLQEQQAELAAQQAEMAEFALQQTAPAVASGSTAGFGLSTGWSNLITLNLTRPAGYTRALVYASGVVVGGNNDALTSAKVYSRIVIQGGGGPETIVPMFEPWAAAAAFAAASLVSLSTDVSVTIQGHLHAGSTSASALPWTNATLVVQGTFLR